MLAQDHIRAWMDRYLGEEEALFLVLFFAGLGVTVALWGSILMPLLTSLVVAYVLDWLLRLWLERGLPRAWGLFLVFSFFFGMMMILFWIVIPLIIEQLKALAVNGPYQVQIVQQRIGLLLEHLPSWIPSEEVKSAFKKVIENMTAYSKDMLAFSLMSLSSLFSSLIYLVVVPIIIFFLLKDKVVILDWLSRFLPSKRDHLIKIGNAMDTEIGNYIRGKSVEIAFLALISYLVFSFVGLNYNALLSVLIGMSAIVPLLGIAVVTVPLVLIAYLQFDVEASFWYVVVSHLVIQGLDSNLLGPLLFSESVKIHPVVIVGSILLFGGLFGFWGVFFAIPLSSLVKTLVKHWPISSRRSSKRKPPADSSA